MRRCHQNQDGDSSAKDCQGHRDYHRPSSPSDKDLDPLCHFYNCEATHSHHHSPHTTSTLSHTVALTVTELSTLTTSGISTVFLTEPDYETITVPVTSFITNTVTEALTDYAAATITQTFTDTTKETFTNTITDYSTAYKTAFITDLATDYVTNLYGCCNCYCH